MKKLAICIPTYNEKENIQKLINEIKHTLRNAEVYTTIIIIDDNSPDGTGKIVDNLTKEYSSIKFKLDPIHRNGKLGLASAYIEAFQKTIKDNYDYILSMDADFSHQPKYILDMLREIKNCDLVIGSRNIKGGGVENWSFFRNMISKGGSLYSRIILGVDIKDFTGGFNMYRKKVLGSIELEKIKSEGYSFAIEMKYRIAKKGFKIKEIPIIFPDRKLGKAKMSKKIFIEAFFRVWQLRFSKM
jgi:dolichol-phosphate mannosyltransferase